VGGLASVLPHCTDGVAVVVPVDLPLLDPARIGVLADAAGSECAACFHAHPLPCALRVDAAARATVAALMQASSDGPSMRHLLAALGAIELEPGDVRDLRPCNTPADWAALTS
jgi:molybdopterin-guanine dinucleotide biosynthesis protein A